MPKTIAVGDTRRAPCGECGGIRNCEVKGYFENKGSDENYSWWVDWFILQCRGCDHVFAQTSSGNSEDYDYVEQPDGSFDYDPNVALNYWPALSAREKPEWMHEYGIDIPGVDDLDPPMIELYKALDADLRILSGIGIRTCFDVASELLGVDSNLRFKEKLDKLVEGNHIGKVDRDRLDVLVEAGNASAHRGWQPSKRDIRTMMDVLEMFVHDAFVAPSRRKKLDAVAIKMKERVPKRIAAAKKPKAVAVKTPNEISPETAGSDK